MKLTPAELPLTLSADVLRLPYQPAVRLVLAEIISLHAATRGCCDCSDAHLAARLTISTDTVNRAVKQLEADGLVIKKVVKEAGFYRTLKPVIALIELKAATNPYPQNAGSPTTRILPLDYPQNAVPPTRILPDPLPAKCGTNTITSNLSIESSNKSSSATHQAAAEKREVDYSSSTRSEKAVGSYHAQSPDASASHTRGRAAKTLAKPSSNSRRREVLFAESEYAVFEHFAAAFAGTDYALANLRYYHEKILAWRQKGDIPRRRDWLATAKQFFLYDISANCLVLDPNTQPYGGAYQSPGHPRARPTATGYVSKYDRQ
ncbi:hypothetical protein H8B13_09015 [Hymenobacter sp. BT188]|uniref:hypothetical protein n=1 Tax=Hymenobacter sp. BT188 TaxID=2763504 RepID=UPI0016514A09|nr:hypothetical protein [Hymenobacter sp. BT188]MBC6606956.1 hypothetical protein [Hymenobacter sp. BT188]